MNIYTYGFQFGSENVKFLVVVIEFFVLFFVLFLSFRS